MSDVNERQSLSASRRTTLVPVRTLQPGDRLPVSGTDEILTVLRTTPHFGLDAVRFEGDDTLWRMHPDTLVRKLVEA